jgi:hypothetical protein
MFIWKCLLLWAIFGLLSYIPTLFCFRVVSVPEIIPPSALVVAERAVGTQMTISEIKRIQYVEYIRQNRAAKVVTL